MSRLVAGSFVAALVGLVVAVGLVLGSLSVWALPPYALVVLGGLYALLRKASALRAKQHEGRTCSCCTSTVFDPVEVV